MTVNELRAMTVGRLFGVREWLLFLKSLKENSNVLKDRDEDLRRHEENITQC